jgi:hypothetical protein
MTAIYSASIFLKQQTLDFTEEGKWLFLLQKVLQCQFTVWLCFYMYKYTVYSLLYIFVHIFVMIMSIRKV